MTEIADSFEKFSQGSPSKKFSKQTENHEIDLAAMAFPALACVSPFEV